MLIWAALYHTNVGFVSTAKVRFDKIYADEQLCVHVCRRGRLGRWVARTSAELEELIVKGEGGDACWLYMAERDGTLAVFGLDVFAPVPEATSLLDGIVDHLLK